MKRAKRPISASSPDSGPPTGNFQECAYVGTALASFIERNCKGRISLTRSAHIKTPHIAMTPTPTVLLIVALFWTLPASAAALVYQQNDDAHTTTKASL